MRGFGSGGDAAERRAGWKLTSLKVLFGGAAILSLMMVFAIQRLPGETVEPAAIPSERFDAAWADAFQTAVVAKKQDKVRQIEMVAATDPKPVLTERVVPEPNTASGPITAQMPATEETARNRDSTPSIKHRSTAESNVCTRHKMHKVVTRGGKSWRCKR